jgi:hypothetical protein
LPELFLETLAPQIESNTAKAIQRGATRYLRALGFSAIAELPLASGRRVDILAVGPTGEVLIVEIKSGVADFRADRKWMEYRDYCDRFFFAIPSGFPREIIPSDAGVIIADAYGAELVRESAYHPLLAARRKALLIRLGRTSSDRLASLLDPHTAS